MSYCFFPCHSKIFLALFDVKLSSIKCCFAFVELTLEFGKAQRTVVDLIEHIDHTMQKSADVRKTSVSNRFNLRWLLLHFFLVSIDSHTPLTSKKVRFIYLRKPFADKSGDIRVDFLCTSPLKIEYPLVVNANGFCELWCIKADSIQYILDDVASYGNELVLSYVILHICN